MAVAADRYRSRACLPNCRLVRRRSWSLVSSKWSARSTRTPRRRSPSGCHRRSVRHARARSRRRHVHGLERPAGHRPTAPTRVGRWTGTGDQRIRASPVVRLFEIAGLTGLLGIRRELTPGAAPVGARCARRSRPTCLRWPTCCVDRLMSARQFRRRRPGNDLARHGRHGDGGRSGGSRDPSATPIPPSLSSVRHQVREFVERRRRRVRPRRRSRTRRQRTRHERHRTHPFTDAHGVGVAQRATIG